MPHRDRRERGHRAEGLQGRGDHGHARRAGPRGGRPQRRRHRVRDAHLLGARQRHQPPGAGDARQGEHRHHGALAGAPGLQVPVPLRRRRPVHHEEGGQPEGQVAGHDVEADNRVLPQGGQRHRHRRLRH